MSGTKAPDPDGKRAIFFKKEEGNSKSILVDAIQHHFMTGHILEQCYSAFTALIKKTKFIRANNFRPISLTNLCYKTIAKLLANRLKATLDKIVSPKQASCLFARMNHPRQLPLNARNNTNNEKKNQGPDSGGQPSK